MPSSAAWFEKLKDAGFSGLVGTRASGDGTGASLTAPAMFSLLAPAYARKEVLAGTFDLDGELAVNPDGDLKSFGHPIGASSLRMLFECWLQLRGEAGKRQIASIDRGRKLALTHNLGGAPGECGPGPSRVSCCS